MKTTVSWFEKAKLAAVISMGLAGSAMAGWVLQPSGMGGCPVGRHLSDRQGVGNGGDVCGKGFNPKANRDDFHHNDAVDEAYLRDRWHKVQEHQQVSMSWEEFKQRGVSGGAAGGAGSDHPTAAPETKEAIGQSMKPKHEAIIAMSERYVPGASPAW